MCRKQQWSSLSICVREWRWELEQRERPRRIESISLTLIQALNMTDVSCEISSSSVGMIIIIGSNRSALMSFCHNEKVKHKHTHTHAHTKAAIQLEDCLLLSHLWHNQQQQFRHYCLTHEMHNGCHTQSRWIQLDLLQWGELHFPSLRLVSRVSFCALMI